MFSARRKRRLVSAAGLVLLACSVDGHTPVANNEMQGVRAGEPAAKQPVEKAEPSPEPVIAQTGFLPHAFPPAIPDTANHTNSWWIADCLRCHETGVANAPMMRHETVPAIAKTGKCRTCHVLIPGLAPRTPKVHPEDALFLPNAFPPMVPASASHQGGWWADDCLLCHENGVRGAPIVRHRGMPRLLLEAKCRTCHVQVRRGFGPVR